MLVLVEEPIESFSSARIGSHARLSCSAVARGRLRSRHRQREQPLVCARRPTGAGWALGFYGGYEHIIGRFSAIAQLGYHAARGFNDPDVPRFYQKFGCRYYVNDRVFLTFTSRVVALRNADGLELGAGYRLRWRPKT